jgi:hypothetical protein
MSFMDSMIVSPAKRMLDANGLSPQEGSQRAMALTDEDLALVTGADGSRDFPHRHRYRPHRWWRRHHHYWWYWD